MGFKNQYMVPVTSTYVRTNYSVKKEVKKNVDVECHDKVTDEKKTIKYGGELSPSYVAPTTTTTTTTTTEEPVSTTTTTTTEEPTTQEQEVKEEEGKATVKLSKKSTKKVSSKK